MARRCLSGAPFFLCLAVFLFSPAPGALHAAKDYSEINAELSGIGPKTITFYTDDAVNIGDEFQIVRGNDVKALVKVVSIKGKLFLADILKQFGEMDFDDKVVRFNKPIPPIEEKKENPPETKKEETPETPVIATTPSVIPSEAKESQEKPKEETVATQPTELKETETQTPTDTVTPVKMEESTEEKTEEQPKETAKVPETPAVIPSEEASAKPQTFGVSFGYSLFVPKSFKVSNSGFKGEARVKIPAGKNLYGALSYAQHRWTDKTTELKLNVFSVSLAYSLKPFVPQTFSFVNDVQLMAGYSNLSSRLSQDTTTLTKSASGLNTGIALQMFKFLCIDYRFHSFTLDFPNGKIKNGEQITASFSYAF